MSHQSFRASYSARWLWTGELDRPVIERGCIVVKDGVIEAVGVEADVWRDSEHIDYIHDFGDAIIVPGFVNAHAHLELTCYRGMLETGPLWPWLSKLIKLRMEPDSAERELKSVEVAIAESLREGVTCVGDISRMPMHSWLLANSPIRAVSFVELISGARQEPNDSISLSKRVSEMAAIDAPPKVKIGLSPHSPYTVTPDDLDRANRMALQNNRQITTHYLETQEEVEWLGGETGAVSDFLERMNSPNRVAGSGLRAAELFAQADFMSRSMLLAHVNYPSNRDIQHIAKWFASVVWCPRAHRYYGHSNHRWRDMVDAGINVCVGTDSAACAPTLSILDELREIKRLNPDTPSVLLLRMGTIHGARALGLSQWIGNLAPAKRADFVAFPVDAALPEEVLEELFVKDVRPIATVIDGKFVFHRDSE